MNARWIRQRVAQALLLVLAVFGAAAPAATASNPDAVGRYLTAHIGSPDAIDRWLAGHGGAISSENPVSDVASSLQVARTVAGHDQTPVSDVASSLLLSRAQFDRTIANPPRPISDTADSLAVARRAAAASMDAAPAPTAFAWDDAGIGAGAALLLVATAAWGFAVIRRHRQLWGVTPKT